MKIASKLVFDYLMAKDIEGYTVDELEHNPKFMTEVVKHDKKSYNTCYDEVKHDYEFTKEIIQKYKDDVEFVAKVAEKFLNSCDYEDEEQSENAYAIKILMRYVTTNLDECDPLRENYFLETSMSISWDQFNAEMIKQNIGKKYENIIGLGFILQKDFHCNKIVLDYIADNYIIDIFTDAIELEENLHNLYKSYKEFEEAGKYKVLANMIAYYDKALAEYALANLESFRYTNMELKRINKNWDYYESIKAKDKEDLCRDLLDKSLSCVRFNSKSEQKKAILFVAKKYGLENEIERLFDNMIDSIEYFIGLYNDDPEDIFEKHLKDLAETKKELDYVEYKQEDSPEFIPNVIKIQKVFEEVLGYELGLEIKKAKKRKLDFKIIPFYPDKDSKEEE